ncbi:hypothetical protein APA_5145 [Pseudanabaena sp. lw0831]|nr:hypothetical protein APA_5145 [Pseudanabaena sp. lw0831]
MKVLQSNTFKKFILVSLVENCCNKRVAAQSTATRLLFWEPKSPVSIGIC